VNDDYGVMYPYALDGDFVVYINDVTLNMRGDEFKCLGCGNELIPVQGRHKVWHFRHKVDADCRGETWLHNTAKRLFFDKFNACVKYRVPFRIWISKKRVCTHCATSCILDTSRASYDLTRYFTKAYLESKDGIFVPDILLTDDGKNKLYVEIAVTHTCDDRKIKSGERIIEIKISSPDDLKLLRESYIEESDARVKFLNFGLKDRIEGDFSDECSKLRWYLWVTTEGRCYFRKSSGNGYPLVDEAIRLAYVAPIQHDSGFSYVQAMHEAVDRHVDIRNCYLCAMYTLYKGSTPGYETVPNFCNFFGDMVRSDYAVRCEHYEVV